MHYYKYREKFEHVEGVTYLELEDGYALRQISKHNNEYIASNREHAVYDFWLAEGYINISELDTDVIEISGSEFEQVWADYCKELSNQWAEAKLEYPIGKKVSGLIKLFYPQGVLISLKDGTLGIADYNECRDSTTPNKLYPNHKVEAVIDKYDEQNMWLVLRESRIVD